MSGATDVRAIADGLKADPAFADAIKAIVTGSLAEIAKQPATSAMRELFAPAVLRDQEKADKRNGVEKMAAMMRYTALAKKMGGRTDPAYVGKEIAEGKFGDAVVAKALTAGDFGSGGALVPSEMVPDIFDALRPRSVLRSLNPTIYPMNDGSLTLPGITNGGSAGYKGEAVGANATSVGTGDVRLVEKELIAIIPISTSLLRVNSGRAEAAIGRDLVRCMAQAEDANFLNGDGTNGKPLGILQRMLPAHSAASAGTSLTAADNDLAGLKKVVKAANVDTTDAAFIMNTTIEEDLMKLRSGDIKAYPEMENGRLARTPYGSSNNMPSGVLAYGSMSDVIIGESEVLEMKVSEDAAYLDSAGLMRAAFSENVVVMRVVAKHDIALRYPAAFAQRTGVNYTGA